MGLPFETGTHLRRPGDEPLIQAAYKDAEPRPESLELVEALHGGKTASDVYLLKEVYSPGQPEWLRVVKVGPRDELRREWEAYDRHVRPFSAKHHQLMRVLRHSLDTPSGTSARAALVYEQAGQAVLQQPETLPRLLDKALRGDEGLCQRLERVLDNLFGVLSRTLHASRKDADWHAGALSTFYPQRLPADVDLRLESLDRLDEAHLDSRKAVKPANDPLGCADLRLKMLAIYGATASQWGREVWLNVSGHPFVARLTNPDALTVRDGELQLRGQIERTRIDLLGDLIRKVLPDFQPHQPGVKLGATVLPNPLVGYHRWLCPERKVPTFTVTGHGDLHAGNVLATNEQALLFDYGLTGPDQPLGADAARLEGTLLREAVAAGALEPADVATLLVALNDTGVFDEDFSPLLSEISKPLARAVRILAALRRGVRSTYPQQWHEDGRWLADYYRNPTSSAC